MPTTLFMLLFVLPVFLAAQPVRNDVVIDEIMADPTPSAGLPEVEFIELKNVSPKPLNLNGWKIGDATTTATITASFTLQPDSFVIVCSNSAVAMLSAYGNAIGVSNFPSLDNDGDALSLRSKEGRLMHAVNYDKSWYNNAVKSEGGWTLEMKDTRNACSGHNNWMASTADKGGTPGKRNATNALNPDLLPPALLQAYATDSMALTLVFDEALDSMAAVQPNAYAISDGIGYPVTTAAVAPFFNKVTLQLPYPLQKNKVYTVTAHGIKDCTGNSIGMLNTVKAGWSTMADTVDAVINEVLFNARADGVDYVEIYNRSGRIIDLRELYIANRTTAGAISSIKQLSMESRLLFPQDYVVVTENPAVVQQQYAAKDPYAFAGVSSMPSFPDDKGTVVLLNTNGRVIDELRYAESWHFALIDNREGIALERIDYHKPTQDAQNWHSAATTAGYGTPGYRNSQSGAGGQADGTISISPAVFSPDNDGYNDVVTISYRFPEPGYVCNVTLYDANGQPVRLLSRNAVCGTTGYFRWDGLDEKSNRLNVGVYVMMAEVFNLKGLTKKFRQVVVLARRLQ